MALLAEQHTESVLINTDNLALRPWRAKEVHDLYAANDLSTQHAAGPSHSYLPAGSGQRVWMSGDEYLILLDAAHSAGTMPMPMSTNYLSCWMVNSRSWPMAKNTRSNRADAFSSSATPCMLFNHTNKPVRMLIFYTPGGVEEFFLAAGTPAQDGVAPPPRKPETTAREIETSSHFQISQAAQVS